MKFSVTCRKQVTDTYEVEAKTAEEACKAVMAGSVKPLKETLDSINMTPTQIG